MVCGVARDAAETMHIYQSVWQLSQGVKYVESVRKTILRIVNWLTHRLHEKKVDYEIHRLVVKFVKSSI
jgi:hypothetical protein